MNVFSAPKVLVLAFVSSSIHTYGALLRQQAGVQLSNETMFTRQIPASELVVAIGKSDAAELCVTADGPVTCAEDAGNYGKRLNPELQPNKDPAPDTFKVTVKTDDATQVCAQRTDIPQNNPGWGEDLQISCTKNVCTCTGGTVVDDPQCIETAENCVSCDDGFTLVTGACNQNTCTCNGGTPKTDRECTQDKGELCKVCDTGYHTVFDKCTANLCTCAGGTAQIGSSCTSDRAEMCANCSPGYDFNGHSCVQSSAL